MNFLSWSFIYGRVIHRPPPTHTQHTHTLDYFKQQQKKQDCTDETESFASVWRLVGSSEWKLFLLLLSLKAGGGMLMFRSKIRGMHGFRALRLSPPRRAQEPAFGRRLAMVVKSMASRQT